MSLTRQHLCSVFAERLCSTWPTFRKTPLIKKGAATAAQRLLTDLLLYTNDLGAFYPVAGRNYPSKYTNPFYQNHSGLIYLLTGKGAADNFPVGSSVSFFVYLAGRFGHQFLAAQCIHQLF
jgi:hypothetical protein